MTVDTIKVRESRVQAIQKCIEIEKRTDHEVKKKIEIINNVISDETGKFEESLIGLLRYIEPFDVCHFR